MHNGAALYASNAGKAANADDAAKLDGLAPEAYIQPQDNMSINSDWRYGIINQQGKNEYGYGYALDMWRCSGTGTITLDNDGIIISHTGGNFVQLSQFFENSDKFDGKIYTMSVLIKGKIYSFTQKFDFSTFPFDKYFVTEDGARLVFYKADADTELMCSVQCRNNHTTKISAVKLEPGPRFTGWPVWNYALELAKCQRYQYYKSGLWKFLGIGICPGFVNGKYELTAFISLPVTMRTNPVADFENLYITGGASSYKTHKVTRIRAVQDYIGGVELALQTDDTLEIGVPYYLAIKDTNGYFYLNANL